MTWPLDRPIRPAYPAVPDEPPASAREPVYVDRELVIDAFNRLALAARRAGRQDLADAVLDERRQIRAPRPTAAPVIPGRPA